MGDAALVVLVEEESIARLKADDNFVNPQTIDIAGQLGAGLLDGFLSIVIEVSARAAQGAFDAATQRIVSQSVSLAAAVHLLQVCVVDVGVGDIFISPDLVIVAVA